MAGADQQQGRHRHREEDADHPSQFGSADHGEDNDDRVELHPFTDQARVDHVILQQAQRGPSFPARPAVSEGAKKFIQRCLTFSQAERPDIFQICEDPYLRRRLT